ncbi:MAG: orotidine-5'-phosphate decarboxylase [Symploca sp. SIO2D2]|nr:orotidine-5'-phosphate decarboxylase [Symploca sp. SIO2D2]
MNNIAPKDRIIVALDVPRFKEAEEAVHELFDYVGAFKVGLELITSQGGPQVVQMIHNIGGKVFFDAKFNDIPNTVAGASRSASNLKVWMFNLHVSCGRSAMQAAAANKGSSLAIAVTVLTSIGDEASKEIFGESSSEAVLKFARMTQECGLDGIVCSPLELDLLKSEKLTDSLITVVPGIRPIWASKDDQSRILTPKMAIEKGASFLVIGRPIMKPPISIGSRVKAAQMIASEIELNQSK